MAILTEIYIIVDMTVTKLQSPNTTNPDSPKNFPLNFRGLDNPILERKGAYASNAQNILKLVPVENKSISSEERCWVCLDGINNVEQISQLTQKAVLGHLRTSSGAENEQSPVHLVHQECHEKHVKSISIANLSNSIVNPWPNLKCGYCQTPVDDQDITPSPISSKTVINIALLASTYIGISLTIDHLLSPPIDKFVKETHLLPGINSSNPLIKYGVLGLWSFSKSFLFGTIANKVTSLISPNMSIEDTLELMFVRNFYSKKQYSDLGYRERRFFASGAGFLTFKIAESYFKSLCANSSQTSIPKTLIFTTDLLLSNWLNFEVKQFVSIIPEIFDALNDEITLSNPLTLKKIASLFSIPDLETSVSKEIFPIDQILNREINYAQARSNFIFKVLCPKPPSSFECPPILKRGGLIKTLFATPGLSASHKIFFFGLEKEIGRLFFEATKKAFQAHNQSTEQIDWIEGILDKQYILFYDLWDLIEKNKAKNNPAFTKKLQELIVLSPFYKSSFEYYNKLLQDNYNNLKQINKNMQICNNDLEQKNDLLLDCHNKLQDSDDNLLDSMRNLESDISKLNDRKDELDEDQIDLKSSILEIQEIVGLTDTSEQLLGISKDYFFKIFLTYFLPGTLFQANIQLQTTVDLEKETEIALRELIKETLGHLVSHYSEEGATATGL